MKQLYRFSLYLILAFSIIGTPSIDAGWLQEDIAVCSDPARQQDPVIVADGAGGSFVAWEDYRNYCIYVQKLGPDGAPLWTADGVEASLPGWDQAIQPDGAGGVFVAFRRDSRSGTFDCPITDSRMYIGRLGATGSILWRKRVTTETDRGSEIDLQMFPDGSGGVLVIWRSGTLYWEPYACDWWDNYHIMAQRIDADGNLLWGPSPVAVCLDDLRQGQYSATREASGSVIVAWTEYRDLCHSVYAQKIDLDGNRLWGDNGAMVICNTPTQSVPRVASDGAGGAFFAWFDARVATHIYAQRLDGSGSALWAPAGVPVCTIDGTKSEIRLSEGPSKSAIILWVMPVGGVSTLFAQRIDATGAPRWEMNGKRLSDARHPGRTALSIPDGEGGTVFAWERVVPQPKNSIIFSMWGFSSTDIFAVGDNGLILHFDGASWTMMTSPTLNQLRGVWGTTRDNMYAVGTNCTIIHYDGLAWHLETYSGSNTQLCGVWGSGPSDVWVVGTARQMYHWNGSSWQRSQFGASGDLLGVHGTSSSNVYAVGGALGYCQVLHYDGTAWEKLALTTPGMLRSVWVSPDNRVFAGSTDKLLLSYGSGWRVIGLGSIGMGYSLWGTDTTNVYGVFESGYLAHWNGAAATVAQASTGKLYGVWGTSGSDIWISGKAHTIRHLEGSEWITQNQLGSDIFMSKVDSAGNSLWDDYDFGAHATVSNDEQTNLAIAPDASGNALLAWRDGRRGNWDIFARKVSISRGPIVATELMNFAAGLFETGINVTWRLSQISEGAAFEVSRAGGAAGTSWAAVAPAITRDGLSFGFVDGAVEAGAQYRYQVRITDVNGSRTLFETDAVTTPHLPLTLFQNAPNPFNPSTTIRYYLPERCRARIAVYDIAGRAIASLADLDQPAGHHSLEWKGRDTLGKPVASGIYFCRLQAGKEMRSRKMVLLR